ncbi:EamA family transporter RarD [Brevibacillus sp. TJ4]|uniref:EamA family transporter RarD n=1 Tax=Brevibacillus sp. TJ4 TaxID=3234853 RepID=UPI0037CED31F
MKRGILYAVIAYLAWGLLPLYWNLFQSMGALEILAHRIVWSFVFVAVILTISRRWRQLRSSLPDIKSKIAMLVCSLTISANWLIFIWAVTNGKVMETSLGYYMNPLISVFFGVLFLKERLSKGQWTALGLAGVGVLYLTFQYGVFPWVALSLALTFALYGLAKKMLRMDGIIGVTLETLLVTPIALLYLGMLQTQGTDVAWSMDGWKIVLLTLSGAATALPLMWFAEATKTLPLSTIGFIQYLSPTMSLITAVFLFGEPFTVTHLISFTCIWSALVVFTVSSMRKRAGSVSNQTEAALKREG